MKKNGKKAYTRREAKGHRKMKGIVHNPVMLAHYIVSDLCSHHFVIGDYIGQHRLVSDIMANSGVKSYMTVVRWMTGGRMEETFAKRIIRHYMPDQYRFYYPDEITPLRIAEAKAKAIWEAKKKALLAATSSPMEETGL